MSETIKAPWTPEQVENLKKWQASEDVPAFTWFRHKDGTISGHDDEGRERRLIPTQQGWISEEGGEVVQDWAWDFMLDGSLLDSVESWWSEARERTVV